MTQPTDADRQRAREIVGDDVPATLSIVWLDELVDRIAAAIAAARAEGFATGWMRAKHRALDAIDHWLLDGQGTRDAVRRAIREATEGQNNGSEAAIKEPGHE